MSVNVKDNMQRTITKTRSLITTFRTMGFELISFSCRTKKNANYIVGCLTLVFEFLVGAYESVQGKYSRRMEVA